MEDYEKAELERKEKEKFEELSSNQIKMSKRLFLLIFGTIGGLFIVLGIIFKICNVTDEQTGEKMWYIFAAVGAFMFLIGVLMAAVMPKSYNYETYKKRIEKYGAYNYYDISATLSLYKSKLDVLEIRVTELEDEVRRLKNK